MVHRRNVPLDLEFCVGGIGVTQKAKHIRSLVIFIGPSPLLIILAITDCHTTQLC